METICTPGSDVMRAVGRQIYYRNKRYRKSTFCVTRDLGDGMLLYHTLTGEMIKLGAREKEMAADPDRRVFPVLVGSWFFVPEDFDESTWVYLVRQALRRGIAQAGNRFGLFTIFTTTCCNARCFYCYESGSTKKTMDEETAMETAAYIKTHARDKVHLKWFGGEPLCNPDAISRICKLLGSMGMEFTSSMVTNGFLADQFDKSKWVDLWRIKRVQITLDGIGAEYNATKDYACDCIDPYKKVLDNIRYLSDMGITVNIRITLTRKNLQSLQELVADLQEKFGGRKNVRVYPAILYEGCGEPKVQFSEDERYDIHRQFVRLYQLIRESGFGGRYRKMPGIKVQHCMADNGKSIVILPDGGLSFCEHHYDDEICGSIYEKRINYGIQAPYLLTRPGTEACRTCFYLPQCMRLEKCEIDPVCCTEYIRERKYMTEVKMEDVYRSREEGRTDGKGH